MKQITLSFLLYLLFGLFNTAYGQTGWKTHFENEKVKIEYRIADCNDKANDINFSYYVLRFENKTKSQLNLQFESGLAKNPLNQNLRVEDYNSLILKPSEIKEGNCQSQEKELRQFFKDNKAIDRKSSENLIVILNVKTYEF